jgi:hypothetical protein
VYIARRIGPTANDEVPRPWQGPVREEPHQTSGCEVRFDQRHAAKGDPSASHGRRQCGAERIEPHDRHLGVAAAEKLQPGGPILFRAGDVIFLQQGMARQFFRQALQPQGGAAHRRHCFAEQQPIAICKDSTPYVQHSEVEPFAHHVGLVVLDRPNVPLHRRMQRGKGGETRCQPQRRQ